MLQVHKVLDRPDPNGYRGMKVGLYCLVGMLIVYGTMLMVRSAYDEPHNKNHIIYVYDVLFNAGTVFQFVTQIVVIVQLFCHLPFIFYIAQEQFLMFVDEYTRKSVSKMIDEFKRIN